jgi:hypothetical protein
MYNEVIELGKQQIVVDKYKNQNKNTFFARYSQKSSL